MGSIVSGLFSGVLFGAGLALSGMTQPAKVIGFLDVAGAWDPSLALVMGGAIAAFAPLYRWLVSNTVPLYAREFMVRADTRIDASLVIGAGIFGLGWGIAGLCPGPGIVSAGSGAAVGITFTLAMLVGMLFFDAYRRWLLSRGSPAGPPAAVKT